MRHFALTSLAFVALTAALGAAMAAPATPAYVTAALNSPDRKEESADDAHRQIAAIMTFTGVKPGQKVVELIPAEGYWTKVFSGIVGSSGHDYTIWPKSYQQYVEDSYEDWMKRVATPQYANVSLLR